MIQAGEPEKKKSLLSKLPRLGRVSQLMLLVGAFLVLFIPLMVIYQQQAGRQAELQTSLANVGKILASPATGTETLDAEMRKAKAELESAQSIYPDPEQGPELVDAMLKLAESSGIAITKTAVTQSQRTIAVVDKKETKLPVLAFKIDLTGQVPKFQSFLMALEEKFPTSEIGKVKITVAEKEGQEDTASMEIDIVCYARSKN